MSQTAISERKLANVQKQGQEWTAGFVASEPFNKLTAKGKKYAEIVTIAFSEWMYRAELRGGREWTGATMANVLSDTFPVKVKEYGEFSTELVDILTAYFTYLKESETIRNADALMRRLETLELASENKEKTEVSEAPIKKESVVAPNYTAAEIARFNRFAMGTMPTKEVASPAPAKSISFEGVGRNELCPCGSGKKFKKCHG